MAYGKKSKKTKKRSGESTDWQSLVQQAADQAIAWREENIEPSQTDATDAYNAEPYGNEEEGRSQVVMTTVRDTIKAIMPSLLRIFFGVKRPVEFAPENKEDVQLAKQQTDFVRYVIRNDNNGFMIFHDWFKDALIRKIGVVKYWWEDMTRVESSEHTGLSIEDLQIFADDETVEDVKIGEQYAGPNGEQLVDATVKRVFKKGRVKILACPPEEVFWSPNARSKADAVLFGHEREMPASDVIALGYDKKIVMQYAGQTRDTSDSTLALARRPDRQATPEEDVQDDSTLPTIYSELYMRGDVDGDDIAELRKFCCVGPNFEILNEDDEGRPGVIVDDAPFALLIPDPEPHTINGLSLADYTMDLQRINTSVVRSVLDSLAEHVDPATVIDETVNVGDALNKERGRHIRVRGNTAQGHMETISQPFLGESGLLVLEYFNQIRENRTGVSKAAEGLDADALQSATKEAVASTLTKGREQIEMIARIFAETGVTELYKGIHKLLVQHQDHERMVRLRNEWVPMDPRQWNADMDLVVTVGVGTGTDEAQLQALGASIEKMMELMQAGAPFLNWAHVHGALVKAAELMGEPDPESLFGKWDEQMQAAFEKQQAEKPPQPDPTMYAAEKVAEVEMMRAQADIAMEEQRLKLETWKAKQQDDRERDKLAHDMEMKKLEMEMKYSVDLQERQVYAEIEELRNRMDAFNTHMDNERFAQIEREKVAQQPAPGATEA
jgi:hypothetical protein